MILLLLLFPPLLLRMLLFGSELRLFFSQLFAAYPVEKLLPLGHLAHAFLFLDRARSAATSSSFSWRCIGCSGRSSGGSSSSSNSSGSVIPFLNPVGNG
jgi:hypothetical protein